MSLVKQNWENKKLNLKSKPFQVICRPKVEDEAKDLTFIPKINHNSRSIAMAKGRNIYQTEKNLIKYQAKKNQKLTAMREDKENMEIEKHRFHPTLLPSKALYTQYLNADPKDDVHKRLFRMANKQKKTEVEHSFSPWLISSASASKLDRPSGRKELVDNLHRWKGEVIT